MRRVLVSVDFSECSEYAAKAAASLVRKTKGKLFVFHVITVPDYEGQKIQALEELPDTSKTLQQIRNKFEEFLKKPFFKGINTAEIILFNDVYQTLIDFSEENDIDLIVVGSHGSSGIRQLIIGSNTQKLIRLSNCPVLVVKNNIIKFDLKKVVFATDFSSQSYHAFMKMSELFEIYKSKVFLLKVVTKDDFEITSDIRKKAKRFADDLGLKNFSTEFINHHSVYEGILEYSQEVKPDIIAMSTEGRSLLYQVFNESIAEKVVNESDLPVLCVKIENNN